MSFTIVVALSLLGQKPITVLGGTGKEDAPEIPTRAMTLTPAKAPVPALKYQLLPSMRDLTPGNAVQRYYRAFSPEWWTHKPEIVNKASDALEWPVADLLGPKGADIAWVANWHALKELDRGARNESCDWGFVERIREEGIGLLLPDIQGFRTLARFNALRIRQNIAKRDFAQAIHAMQSNMALGRHNAEHGCCLIQYLVGVAIMTMTLDQATELVGTPGSPNLYWALSNLPQPVARIQRSLESERAFGDHMFPGLRKAIADPTVEPPPLDRNHVSKTIQLAFGGSESAMALAVMAAAQYPHAVAYLKSTGRSDTSIRAMNVTTAVGMFELAQFDIFFDDFCKWVEFPFQDADKGLAKADEALKVSFASSRLRQGVLARLLLPAIQQVLRASIRTDRRIAALRVLEALRLHAAETGALPENLQTIQIVPVPRDPINGKPFLYTYDSKAGVAIMTAPPPEGEKPRPGNSFRYEIRLAKP